MQCRADRYADSPVSVGALDVEEIDSTAGKNGDQQLRSRGALELSDVERFKEISLSFAKTALAMVGLSKIRVGFPTHDPTFNHRGDPSAKKDITKSHEISTNDLEVLMQNELKCAIYASPCFPSRSVSAPKSRVYARKCSPSPCLHAEVKSPPVSAP
jgi:hypothetical protein